jgi:two-component system chemotaxis sensor kinase CheA
LLLRDRLIPLVRFADLLGMLPTYDDEKTGQKEVDRRTRLADRRSPRHESGPEALASKTPSPAEQPFPRDKPDRRRNAAGALEIAVVTTGTQTYGLVVGAFHDTEEIVVKPLGCHLKELAEYAGATILGDGAVALILDVAGLAAKANLSKVAGTARARELSEEAQQEKLDTHALLLFHNAPDELCAIPLDTVLRIEHVRPEKVETLGGHRTMQYHDGFLPLVTLSDCAQVKTIANTQDLAVMICRMRGREVGLLGAMPVDVIETRAKIDQKSHRQKGIAGSAIIHDQTALITDLFELVDSTWPEWAVEQATEQPHSVSASNSAVLLAEDSDFFRAQVVRFLEEGGHTVLAAPDGQAAWELLLANLEKVSLVVTDIEMPRMTGIDLARRIRGDERTAKLPIIALSSLAGDEDVARGKAAGIDEYLVKLDRDTLLERVREVCSRMDRELVEARA